MKAVICQNKSLSGAEASIKISEPSTRLLQSFKTLNPTQEVHLSSPPPKAWRAASGQEAAAYPEGETLHLSAAQINCIFISSPSIRGSDGGETAGKRLIIPTHTSTGAPLNGTAGGGPVLLLHTQRRDASLNPKL